MKTTGWKSLVSCITFGTAKAPAYLEAGLGLGRTRLSGDGVFGLDT